MSAPFSPLRTAPLFSHSRACLLLIFEVITGGAASMAMDVDITNGIAPPILPLAGVVCLACGECTQPPNATMSIDDHEHSLQPLDAGRAKTWRPRLLRPCLP
ncbi:hypothetical protein QBC32DRAFT_346154 [Pseudoneurospora amorphoporcata]|uniref:Secreted protein n=1 Tax=Pseudoneurospora amorphoporcata TaxID=241081 RepID=A0AAN6NRN0_9PEZI|nr:hypothetical protein QBC32DRAFT_346154 [Pseudoneurospora amorphoporcata]